MKKLVIHFLLFIALGLVACKDPIPEPEAASLRSPADNESCLYVALGAATANVSFEWSEALNTDRYQVEIINLSTGESFGRTTEFLFSSITLDRGFPYAWSVTTSSEISSVRTESETRVFYLEGQEQFTYVPFPAELLAPSDGETISLNQGNITLSWRGADLDNNIANYTLLLGTSPDDLETIAREITVLNYSLSLSAGTAYFWKIISIDEDGNRSESVINEFQTAP